MEDRYLETHRTWNNIAQVYEEQFMELDLYNDTYQRFCKLLSRLDASLLEIGCGPGNITRHMLDLNPKLNILATDVSKNMIELAQKNNPAVAIQELDCRNLNSINRTFDGIICGFTIPYLSKPDCLKLIADCGKRLAKDGVLYMSFVSGDYEKSGFISGSSGDRTYFYYHDRKTIEEELALNHMTVVDSILKEYKRSDGTSETHTIIIAQR